MSFHAVDRPEEPLELRGVVVVSGVSGVEDWTFLGTFPQLALALEPGGYSDLRIEARGFKPKRLGPIEVLSDRQTAVDVELEPDE